MLERGFRHKLVVSLFIDGGALYPISTKVFPLVISSSSMKSVLSFQGVESNGFEELGALICGVFLVLVDGVGV